MDKIEPWVIHKIPIKDDDDGTDEDPAAKRAKYDFEGADDDEDDEYIVEQQENYLVDVCWLGHARKVSQMSIASRGSRIR